jgi:hypothetical protein
MRFITRVIAITVLISGVLTAQDIVGRWVGVADTTDEAGTKRQERHTIEIKSEDGKLTGVRFNRSGNGVTPFEVQQDGAKVNLYHFLPLDGGEHLRWKLELKDGSLVGTFSALHDNPRKWIYDRIGPMTLTKVAPQAAAPAVK